MITFLLTILLTAILILALLTYTLYCYEETNQTGKPLRPYLALAAKTALRSMLSEIIILLLHPLGLWPRLWKKPAGGRDLVVLTHGLFHNQSAWIFFRRWLQDHGFAPVCLSYASWGAEWNETVDALREDLKALLATHPDREVHLVGHSMGGLLLWSALAELEDKDSCRIKSLVTMGTPFAGSKLSPFGLSSLGRYLGYEGETVRRVSGLPLPAHVQRLALYSPTDNMVLPNAALRCKAPGWHELETTPVSHVAMLHSRKVFREVQRWISAACADEKPQAAAQERA
jgi:pimeloyl-ACP methyl ester carboxylesterase